MNNLNAILRYGYWSALVRIKLSASVVRACCSQGRQHKNFQGEANERKDRKIALLNLFQGGGGVRRKKDKKLQKKTEK